MEYLSKYIVEQLEKLHVEKYRLVVERDNLLIENRKLKKEIEEAKIQLVEDERTIEDIKEDMLEDGYNLIGDYKLNEYEILNKDKDIIATLFKKPNGYVLYTSEEGIITADLLNHINDLIKVLKW